MSDLAITPRAIPQPITIPVREWAPWAIFGGVVMLFLVLHRRVRAGCDVTDRRDRPPRVGARCTAPPRLPLSLRPTHTMVRSLLIRGMLVGLLAGLAAFGFARWKGEPNVNKAIAFETYVEYDVHHEAAEHDDVSRSVQDSAGLGTGAIIYGVAMGGIFAIVFSVAYGRIGLRTARGTAGAARSARIRLPLRRAAAEVSRQPAGGRPSRHHRPANDALSGDDRAVDRRRWSLAVIVRRHLCPASAQWNATLIVGGGYVAVIMLCYLLLPGSQRGAPAGDTGGGRRRHRRRRHVPALGPVELPRRVARNPGDHVDHARAGLRSPRPAAARPDVGISAAGERRPLSASRGPATARPRMSGDPG